MKPTTDTKFTPGPWRYCPPHNSGLEGAAFAISSPGRWIGLAAVTPSVLASRAQEVEANARLIAAAPEMLDALQFVAKFAAMKQVKGEPLPSQLVGAVAAAIRKASGE